jgi:hypothetical protein
MRTILVSGCLAVVFTLSNADDFLRRLPDRNLTNQITAERFRNTDAVIILKEQSFKVEPGELFYRGIQFTGMQTTRTVIIIVKVLNEAGVSRYATFEETYPEYFGDEFPAGFGVKARVQKENDDVIELEEEDITVTVSRETPRGDPLERKVLFKMPNVSPGDIIQIEQSLTIPLSRSNSGIFFYNAVDPILFSNLSITLPARTGVTHYSFPPERVGPPRVEQLSSVYGAGQTYFWSLKNLNKIVNEPFSPPFEDQSLITAFVAHSQYETTIAPDKLWIELADDFVEDYLDGDAVSKTMIKELGFEPTFRPTTLAGVDSLYAALRRTITLLPYSSLYPMSEDVDKIFDRKKGDASDLAYIMFNILGQWGLDPRCVWVRDKRNGTYDKTVASTQWFDRLGVFVTVGGKDRLYVFDRGISSAYELPWYFRGINVAIISKGIVEHRMIGDGGFPSRGSISESHVLYLDSSMTVMDSLRYSARGWRATRLRSEFYDLDKPEITENIRSISTNSWLKDIRSIRFNEAADSPVFVVDCDGPSKADVDFLDTLIIIKPRNMVYRWFHEFLATPVRHNHIVLPEQFDMTASWTIKIPHGFEIRSTPTNRSIGDLQKVPASIIYRQSSEGIHIKASIKFETLMLNAQEFPALLRLINSVSQEVGRELVFQRLKH